MTTEPDNLALEYLRNLRTEMAGLRDVKRRLTSLEGAVALVHGDFSGQSVQIDRLENRLEPIERRLNLTDARPMQGSVLGWLLSVIQNDPLPAQV